MVPRNNFNMAKSHEYEDSSRSKSYYEIVNEGRPLSGFFPHMLICIQKCISNHVSKQSSKFQSGPSYMYNCFTIDVWKINFCMQQFFLSFFLIVIYLIWHIFWSVLTCDILRIGLLSVQYLFKTIICASLRMKKTHQIPLKTITRLWLHETSELWYIC